MARFLLVHGAWHGGWCFRDLQAELERRGHVVSAPDLPCEQLGLTPHDYARLIGPQPDAVVVGHSLAGQTIGLVDAGLRVYLAAIPPVVERQSEAFVPGWGGFRRYEDGRSYWPDAPTAAMRLYADCPRAQAEWAFSLLRRQAPLPSAAAPFGAADVVVATRNDCAVDPAWQRRTARAHGARLLELDAGHFPFLTGPGELADLLVSLS